MARHYRRAFGVFKLTEPIYASPPSGYELLLCAKCRKPYIYEPTGHGHRYAGCACQQPELNQDLFPEGWIKVGSIDGALKVYVNTPVFFATHCPNSHWVDVHAERAGFVEALNAGTLMLYCHECDCDFSLPPEVIEKIKTRRASGLL